MARNVKTNYVFLMEMYVVLKEALNFKTSDMCFKILCYFLIYCNLLISIKQLKLTKLYFNVLCL